MGRFNSFFSPLVYSSSLPGHCPCLQDNSGRKRKRTRRLGEEGRPRIGLVEAKAPSSEFVFVDPQSANHNRNKNSGILTETLRRWAGRDSMTDAVAMPNHLERNLGKVPVCVHALVLKGIFVLVPSGIPEGSLWHTTGLFLFVALDALPCCTLTSFSRRPILWGCWLQAQSSPKWL